MSARKWSQHNRKTDKVTNFLDDALGISGVTGWGMEVKSNPEPKPKKKKKQKSFIVIIDKRDPHKVRVKGFKPKGKRDRAKEVKEDMTMYGW